jgi:hypothetical protein
MAIAVGSFVLLGPTGGAGAPLPIGIVDGVGTGGAGSWDVQFQDGSHLPNASTAGLGELVASAPIGGDPAAGDIIVSNNDVNSTRPLQYAQAFTNGGLRYWQAFPPGGVPGGGGFACLSTTWTRTGKLPL